MVTVPRDVGVRSMHEVVIKLPSRGTPGVLQGLQPTHKQPMFRTGVVLVCQGCIQGQAPSMNLWVAHAMDTCALDHWLIPKSRWPARRSRGFWGWRSCRKMSQSGESKVASPRNSSASHWQSVPSNRSWAHRPEPNRQIWWRCLRPAPCQRWLYAHGPQF